MGSVREEVLIDKEAIAGEENYNLEHRYCVEIRMSQLSFTC